ncbi:MAG: PilN domain-containing protein [Deltaproteobacteria bacterium]|nr:PilN domain-containing protein [Deltaproteobacteria bacterium]
MIRINLLQVRATRERRKSSVATQLVVFVLLLAGEIGAFVWLYMDVTSELETKNDAIQEIQSALDAKRREVSSLDAKQQELQEINAKRDVIGALQAAKTGPMYMVAELMRILSKNVGPRLDDATQRMVNQDPNRNFRRDWDFRRVWIREFEETDREVTIEGTALDVSDISEFQRRLNLSQYFEDVRWVRSPEATEGPGEQSLYDFTLKGRAVYQ